MTKILIVEDEIKLASLLIDYLTLENFECHHLDNGALVVNWVQQNKPKLILLDLMLPNKDGITICKEIRLFSEVPILMMTARIEEKERLLGLEFGADDYICKPYSPREVVARVKSVLRRTVAIADVDQHQTDNAYLSIDTDRFVVTVCENEVELTPIEFRILNLFGHSHERVLSRDYLIDNVYKDNRIVNGRTVDSHIKNLRKKITQASNGKIVIQTVYGIGYRLVD